MRLTREEMAAAARSNPCLPVFFPFEKVRVFQMEDGLMKDLMSVQVVVFFSSVLKTREEKRKRTRRARSGRIE